MNYVKWLEDDNRLPLDFIISIKEKKILIRKRLFLSKALRRKAVSIVLAVN